MPSIVAPSAEQILWQVLSCRNGARLDVDTWLAVAAVSVIFFWFFVRYLLRIAKPAKRESLHSAAVVFSLVALFIAAGCFVILDNGHFTWPRSGRKVLACSSPHEFWGLMTVGDLCVTGCLAFVAMCVIRLRRPYRRFSDPVR